MTIIDDYLELQETYAAKYGENTIVLMQIGHFYEAYGVDNDIEKSNAENIYRLSDILNIQLTRKNKSIIQNSTTRMIDSNEYIYQSVTQYTEFEGSKSNHTS